MIKLKLHVSKTSVRKLQCAYPLMNGPNAGPIKGWRVYTAIGLIDVLKTVEEDDPMSGTYIATDLSSNTSLTLPPDTLRKA